MPRKIVVLRDKYGSTTRYYPKVLKQCLPIELQDMLPTTKGNFTGKIYFDEWDTNALSPVIEIKKDATHKAELRVWGNNVQGNDIYGVEMQYQEGNDLATVSIDKDGILLSGINKDININTTGTAKLYINGVEYQAGGGSQLYQHHLIVNGFNIRYDGSERSSRLDIYYIADNDTTFSTISDMISYFREHPTVVRGQAYASQFTSGGFDMIISKIYAGTNDNTLAMTCSRIDGSNFNSNNVDNEGSSGGSSSIKVHVCSPL